MSRELDFESHIGVLEYLLNAHYVYIPKEVVTFFGGKMKMRVWCSINGQEAFQGGFMSLGEGAAYITVNRKRLKTGGLEKGCQVKVHLKEDTSEFGMDISTELKEVLHQDPEGEERFMSLSAGKKRYIIHYVNSVKSSQKRIDRALLLIGNLKKQPLGKESFREMLGLPPRED